MPFQNGHQISWITGMIIGWRPVVFWIRRAGDPGLKRDSIKLRVPPVPRSWGPGRGSRTAGSASSRAVANLPRRLSTPIRSLRLRICPFDHADGLTTASPLALPPAENTPTEGGLSSVALPSPVPKGEGPGPPSARFGNLTGTGGILSVG